MPLIIKTSSDQIAYSAVQTPAEIKIPGISYSGESQDSDGYIFHHFYVSCETIRATGLPLDANPREPTRASVVKEMATTLRETPSLFHHWNNGITIVCDGAQVDDDVITLDFKSGSGICNGGHTYFAISTFPIAIPLEAKVHIEVIAIPVSLSGEDRRHAINDIARNRNANRALLPTTQADFLGYYTPFKTALGSHADQVKWHEGDSAASSEAISSETLIRMLSCMDPFWFQHPVHCRSGRSHKSAATGASSIHAKWFDGQGDHECNLHHMAPLALEIFTINDLIAYSIRHDDMAGVSGNFRATLFYREWLNAGDRTLKFRNPGEVGAKLPNPAVMLFLGAFRTNVWLGLDNNGDPAFAGMLMEPSQLWQKTYSEYLKSLMGIFSDTNQDPSAFIRAEAPYGIQLLTLEYGRHLPKEPAFLTEIASGARYKKESNQSDATHILLLDDGGFASMILANVATPEQRRAGYTYVIAS